jgi:hypothetical protein
VRPAPARTPKQQAAIGHVWIGTSGWTYDGWRGRFYPEEVPRKHWLRHYASRFPTTEINGSFYRTPSLEAVGAWRDDTPRDFVFAWKASKFITHWKRLTTKCESSIALMETRLDALAPKVAAVLFQLPPQFAMDRERLGLSCRFGRGIATHSNSATRVGTTTPFSICCENMTSRCVCPITGMLPHPGRSPRASPDGFGRRVTDLA